MNKIFLVQDIVFPRNFFARFFTRKSVCRIFFSEITHKPLKSQIVGP